jgi:hypothetical protein
VWNQQSVDVYGNQWIDYAVTPTTIKQRERLKAAYEKSGMLESTLKEIRYQDLQEKDIPPVRRRPRPE